MWPNRAHSAQLTNHENGHRLGPRPAREEGDKEQKGKVHQARTPPSRQATKSRPNFSSRLPCVIGHMVNNPVSLHRLDPKG